MRSLPSPARRSLARYAPPLPHGARSTRASIATRTACASWSAHQPPGSLSFLPRKPAAGPLAPPPARRTTESAMPAARIEQLAEESRAANKRLEEADKALQERIASLVEGPSEFIRQRPQQWPAAQPGSHTRPGKPNEP